MSISGKLNLLSQKAFIVGLIRGALQTQSTLVGYLGDSTLSAAIERPKDEAHGDWSFTLALRAAKELGKNPHEVGADIVQSIEDALSKDEGAWLLIESVELAGPGFVNIKLSQGYHQQFLAEMLAAGEGFAKPNSVNYSESCINLEFVSANPTGPLHVGHGRWAAIGNALGNILEYCGDTVQREYYINDAGAQVQKFGQSIQYYIDQADGSKAEFPEDGYGGEYVKELAAQLGSDPNLAQAGISAMIVDISDTLKLQNVDITTWFSEQSLLNDGLLDKTLHKLKTKQLLYEQEGATWLKTSECGDDKDRVLVKANGETTYFLSDIAYHINKLERGCKQLINIWGADHHGYVARLQAALTMVGLPNTLEVLLGQLVKLLRDGQPVKMSKRTGEMVTLRELLEEVGADAVNFIMLSRSLDQPIEFDIEEAKKQDSTNPVYYVQYAHARICSILEKASGVRPQMTKDDKNGVRPQPSCTNSEISLIKQIERAGETIETAAIERAPHKLVHYALELAKRFHHFYTECRIINENNEVDADRLQLAEASRITLALMLRLLGISAPKQM